MPLVQTRRLTQSPPLRSVRALIDVDGGDGGAAALKRSAGVAIFNAWCGRLVL